ncbi:MAG: hypothetical protein KIC56_02210 [Clostridium sp.]|nr:hypothetical protein [Clostridium sp.]
MEIEILAIIILGIAWIFSTVMAGKIAGKIGVIVYLVYGMLIISPFVFGLINKLLEQ